MSESTVKPRVALLGLGIMGSGMAGRLLFANFPLTVYNRNAEKTKPFISAGATAANSPREAASGAEIVIGMVADDNASRAIWLGENGALAGAMREAILVEASTLSVGWISELAAAATQRGCELLDAPVTGTKSHATAGELLFLVGGSAKALNKVRSALAAMSREIVHLGPTGSGAFLKLINNFLCGAQAASLAEAVSLIGKSSLDRDKALSILTNGAPGSPLLKAIAARATARDFTPNFLLRLMAKDLSYAAAEGQRCGAELRTAAIAEEIFRQAIAKGYGDQDFAAVIEFLQNS